MEIEVSKQYDVVVIGGGVGGITAAVASARSGAKTVLIEEDTVLGGALTDYYVAMLCGKPTQGILLEILDVCRSKYRLPHGMTWFLPYAWQRAIDEIVAREPNLEVMTGARLIDVNAANGKINTVTCLCESNTRKIQGKVFVEATGTGLFAELAGCDVMYGRDAQSDFNEKFAPEKRDDMVQEVTWMYISQKLPGYKHFDMSKLENATLGILPQHSFWFHADPEKALELEDGIYLHWGCKTRCADTRDSVEIGKAQREALRLMSNDHATLHENGYAVHLAPKLGVREIRRIRGQYVMRCEDIVTNFFPEDTIAVGKYCLDSWGENGVTSLKPWEGYGIPYRSLVPLKADNLVLSGRVISGSHIAMSSYRVMPIVGNIGQAAGVAAAMSSLSGSAPADISVLQLRDRLVSPEQNQVLVP